MCLIALAHHSSERWPLVIAANRDEFYERPTRSAHVWDDDPSIVGGRDLRAGGSWLAVTCRGRFAAVTNIRGGAEPPNPRSRGVLVGDFVRSVEAPLAYARRIAAVASSFAGFHLIVGDADGVAHVSNGGAEAQAYALEDGILAISNAPPAIDWPKVATARQAMQSALTSSRDAERLMDELTSFLTTPRGGPIESEVFVALPERGYGTRSSTVVVITAEGEVLFREVNQPDGEVREFRARDGRWA